VLEKRTVILIFFITYQILFIISVTVATIERSFSNLKLLKNYLSAVMSQERVKWFDNSMYREKFIGLD
jgi:hypothetical protein